MNKATLILMLALNGCASLWIHKVPGFSKSEPDQNPVSETFALTLTHQKDRVFVTVYGIRRHEASGFSEAILNPTGTLTLQTGRNEAQTIEIQKGKGSIEIQKLFPGKPLYTVWVHQGVIKGRMEISPAFTQTQLEIMAARFEKERRYFKAARIYALLGREEKRKACLEKDLNDFKQRMLAFFRTLDLAQAGKDLFIWASSGFETGVPITVNSPQNPGSRMILDMVEWLQDEFFMLNGAEKEKRILIVKEWLASSFVASKD